jgi:DNA-directed RNA polymerase specialized sigma24 family protein
MIRKPPTKEAFDRLLAWLDPDREKAAEKYQKIRSQLVKIFSCHGCVDPDALADEIMDRVTSKIDWLEENYVGEPTPYFCGVARNVLREYWRTKVPPPIPPREEKEDNEEEDRKYHCLDKCMTELPEPGQSLVLAYYEEEGHSKIVRRKELADELGITLQALRLRVFHLRVRLSKCIESCLSQSPA